MKLLSRLTYRATVAARREDVFGHLRRLEESQWWDAATLEAHRIERLRVLLAHAQRTVPAHTKRFAEAGFDPARLQSLADLEALPAMEKEDLRANWESFRSSEPGDGITRDHTSGSTGHPSTT